TCVKCAIECPAGEIEDPLTHHCYLRVPGASTDWNAAQSACAASGAYLAVINSPVENALLQASLPGPMWMGASRLNTFASFKWLNTDPLCYANWDGGEPSGELNRNCALIQANGIWSNDDCKQKKGYLCERDN
ncbi:MAG: C-type lectin domain-containing protein, partial [Byssovorax sp.]